MASNEAVVTFPSSSPCRETLQYWGTSLKETRYRRQSAGSCSSLAPLSGFPPSSSSFLHSACKPSLLAPPLPPSLKINLPVLAPDWLLKGPSDTWNFQLKLELGKCRTNSTRAAHLCFSNCSNCCKQCSREMPAPQIQCIFLLVESDLHSLLIQSDCQGQALRAWILEFCMVCVWESGCCKTCRGPGRLDFNPQLDLGISFSLRAPGLSELGEW